MIALLLRALPTLVQFVPALVTMIENALDGGEHADEAAWCAHIPGLEDVCNALREGHTPTVAAVNAILSGQEASIANALEALAKRRASLAW